LVYFDIEEVLCFLNLMAAAAPEFTGLERTAGLHLHKDESWFSKK